MRPISFSPRSFLKARRPERFSDTVVAEATELDRSLLEFHLSSLTSRSQETDFERFARRLCEREICPNLLPQTGPTGGGDSKVDSETYPVADALALAWYIGLGREAAQERWAFAFSAKADWPPKVRSDIAKIRGTAREYTKAFFVTNQAVPDRKRAEVEDALRTQYGIDVRILDRTWILDRVFEGRHEEFAVNELGVTALSRRDVIKGPLDVKREGALEEVEWVERGQVYVLLIKSNREAIRRLDSNFICSYHQAVTTRPNSQDELVRLFKVICDDVRFSYNEFNDLFLLQPFNTRPESTITNQSADALNVAPVTSAVRSREKN
jgi:hypothetical protein